MLNNLNVGDCIRVSDISVGSVSGIYRQRVLSSNAMIRVKVDSGEEFCV